MSEPISILIVDDHAVFREGLAKVLRNEGLGVIGAAASGAAACDQLHASVPDLVVSDLQMEPMNGLQLIGEIRARGWAVPVLIMSHREEGPVVESALEAGAAGYVGKSQGGAAIAGACRQVVTTGQYRPPASGRPVPGLMHARAALHAAPAPHLILGLPDAEGPGNGSNRVSAGRDHVNPAPAIIPVPQRPGARDTGGPWA